MAPITDILNHLVAIGLVIFMFCSSGLMLLMAYKMWED